MPVQVSLTLTTQHTQGTSALCTPLQVSEYTSPSCCKYCMTYFAGSLVPYRCNVCRSWLIGAWAVCRRRTMGCQPVDVLTDNSYVASWWGFQVPQSQLMDLQEQDHGAVVCPDCVTLSPSASTLQIHLDENSCAQSFKTQQPGLAQGGHLLTTTSFQSL